MPVADMGEKCFVGFGGGGGGCWGWFGSVKGSEADLRRLVEYL
jgi:hypothetical protein